MVVAAMVMVVLVVAMMVAATMGTPDDITCLKSLQLILTERTSLSLVLSAVTERADEDNEDNADNKNNADNKDDGKQEPSLL